MDIKFVGMEFGKNLQNENFKLKSLTVEHDNRFFHVSLAYKHRKLVEIIITPDQKKTPVNQRKNSISWWNTGKWMDRASDPIAAEVSDYFTTKMKI